MNSKSVKNDSKKIVSKTRAAKVKEATKKGMTQYANALRELAHR